MDTATHDREIDKRVPEERIVLAFLPEVPVVPLVA